MNVAAVIDHRFCGPPRSANGGYTCGVAAEALGAEVASVRLLAPPPLGVDLRAEPEGDGVVLRGPDGPVASARAGELGTVPPPPVALDEAERRAAAFDEVAYRAAHPFPRCFTCGPDRSAGDGLRLFPAATGHDAMVVWPWTPHESVVDASGLVEPRVMWAALDCPSGLAWMMADLDDVPPMVLGSMTARIDRRPRAGERLVTAGWRGDADGRRRAAGSAIWDTDGAALAIAEAVWVVLDPEQAEAFTGGDR